MLQLIQAKAARKVRKSSARAAPAQSQGETRNALWRVSRERLLLVGHPKVGQRFEGIDCLPEAMLAEERTGSEPHTGCSLVDLAFACDQLPWDRHPSWGVLVSFFRYVCCSHDGRSRLDLLDLHQYKQRIAGPVHACKLHRLLVIFSPPSVTARQEVIW